MENISDYVATRTVSDSRSGRSLTSASRVVPEMATAMAGLPPRPAQLRRFSPPSFSAMICRPHALNQFTVWVCNMCASVHAAPTQGASGGDSGGLTCPFCAQEILAGMHSPHTKGIREIKISWAHRGKLVFWTKSSWSRHASKKKRHHLRLTTHADVASFNAATKPIDQADRLQKWGSKT